MTRQLVNQAREARLDRLAGHPCRYHPAHLFLLQGTGANGKSVFLSILRELLGAYAYNAPFATFELRSRTDITNDLAALAGRRLVTASETNEGTRLNEARIKALTGGDPVTARFLYGEHFTFRPQAKIFLAVIPNHSSNLPAIVFQTQIPVDFYDIKVL